jgi:hypothetical protein
VSLIVVSALALAALGAAFTDLASYWPLTYLGDKLAHLNLLRGTQNGARGFLLHLLRQVVG